MSKKIINVTPVKSKWKVDGISKSYNNRKEAVDAGARLGRRNGNAELVVKKMNGQIGEKRTYGKDPFPPKG